MKELIAVGSRVISEGAEPTVNARELHGFLGVGKVFAAWIQDRIKQFSFVENQDFIIGFPDSENQKGRGGDRRSKEYYLTLDMAKELAMIERTPKGKEARQYFIACEKELRQVKQGMIPAVPARTDSRRDPLMRNFPQGYTYQKLLRLETKIFRAAVLRGAVPEDARAQAVAIISQDVGFDVGYFFHRLPHPKMDGDSMGFDLSCKAAIVGDRSSILHSQSAKQAQAILEAAQKATREASEAALAAQKVMQEILQNAQKAREISLGKTGEIRSLVTSDGNGPWMSATDLANAVGDFHLPKGKSSKAQVINDVLCDLGLATRVGPEKQVQPCGQGEQLGRMVSAEVVQNGYTIVRKVCKWKKNEVLPIIRKSLEERGLCSQMQML